MEEKKKDTAKKTTEKSTQKKVEEKEFVVKEEKTVEFKKDNSKRLIITICAAILAFVAVYFAYNNVYSSKAIFEKAINKGYSKLERYIDDDKLLKDGSKPTIVTADVKFKMEVDESFIDDESKEMIENFNKLQIKEKIGLDQKNNEMLFLLNYLNGEDDLINIEGLYKDNKMFLYLKNAYDKYIEIPIESDSNVKNVGMNISNDDLKYVLKKSKNSLIKNMDSKDFKKSSEKIKKGKKYIKVTKITYGLSEKSTTELALHFLEDISKDEKYIKILAKSSSTSEKEIKNEIKESIKEIKDVLKEGKLDKEVKVNFGILVKGITKKHVGYIFSTVDNAKLIYYTNGNNKEMRLSKENIDLLSASTKGNETVVTLGTNGQEITLTITKSEKNKKITYDYDLDSMGTKLSGKLTIDRSNEKKDGSGVTKVNAEVSMMGLVKFKIIGNIKTEFVKKLDLPDTSDSVKAEDLSDEEQEEIMEKLMNNESLKSFTNKLGI